MMTVNIDVNSIARRRGIRLGVYLGIVLGLLSALNGCTGWFENIKTGSVADLTRSDWVLSDMADVDILTDIRSTLKFANAGEASGFSGCNRYNGVMVLGDADIAVDNLSLTSLSCRMSFMEFEQAYIERLQKVSFWTLRRNSLRLNDASGVTQLRFRRMGTPVGSNI